MIHYMILLWFVSDLCFLHITCLVDLILKVFIDCFLRSYPLLVDSDHNVTFITQLFVEALFEQNILLALLND